MLLWSFEGALCLLLRAKPRATFTISAVLPAGKHLFPFRTEKLSLPGPMVLGGQPPGRVGRRRLVSRKEPRERLFFVLLRCCFALDAIAPGRIEAAQPAHSFRDRRVRDEQRAEPAL